MPPVGAENETSATAGVPRAVNRFVTFLTTRLTAPTPTRKTTEVQRQPGRELRGQAHDRAHHQQPRRARRRRRDLDGAQRRQRSRPAPALRGRGADDHGGGRVRRPAARQQALRDARALPEPHQHDQRQRARREAVEQRTVGRLVMAGDDREAGREAPVRDGNAGQRRRRDGRRDARDDLERNAGARERERFLSAAPEHVRIAALQPHHLQTASRVLDEQAVQHVLIDRLPAGALADEEPARGRRQRPQLLRRQRVVEHQVGLCQPARAAHGDRDRRCPVRRRR